MSRASWALSSRNRGSQGPESPIGRSLERGKIQFFVAAILLTLVGVTEAKAQCTPGPQQVAFFVDIGFNGQCVVRNLGNYPNASSIGLPNDSISSIKVGPGTQVFVCQDDSYGGRCELITSDAADLRSHPIGNDQISSVKVQPSGASTACNPNNNQAAFFVDINFQGACVVKDLGDYPKATTIGLPNDSISSIRVGPNTQAFVCQDDYYGGRCEVISGNAADLRGHLIGNDQISSAKVQPIGAPTSCPIGPSEVAFFVDANFKGGCEVRSLGDYPNMSVIGLPNDSLSSVRIGANVQAVLCVDANFGGDCQLFTTDAADLTHFRIGNDSVSSARVQRRGQSDCPPAGRQASFYVNADFIGPCVVRNPGDYPNPPAIGLPNDSISSIRVGQGMQVILCKDDNFLNDCQRFSGDVQDLTGTRIGNDSVSSLRVETLGFQECPPGANQATFYMHADFLAPCSTKALGDYPTISTIGLPDTNASLSSVRVNGVQVCACTDENFGTSCEVINHDIPDMSVTQTGNDSMRSARVQRIGAACSAVPPKPVSVACSQAFITNCADDKQAVRVWMQDLTAGQQLTEVATAGSRWSADGISCPVGGSPPVVSLKDKHAYYFVIVDPARPNCGGKDDPTNFDCIRTTANLQGSSAGNACEIPVN